jgi:hypothetical protein
VKAGTSLIILAINSPNFVHGSAGWSINNDGTAEFSSATIRGELDIGIAGAEQVKIGGVATAPAALQTFYSPNTVVGSTIARTSGGEYKYTVWLKIAPTGEMVQVEGVVNSGQIYETVATYFDPSSGIARTVALGDFFGARTDGLTASGCDRVFVETASGSLRGDRSWLPRWITYALPMSWSWPNSTGSAGPCHT